MFLCSLSPYAENCPFLSEDKQHCTSSDTKCSFRKEQKTQTAYVRKERWYEKYYKK